MGDDTRNPAHQPGDIPGDIVRGGPNTSASSKPGDIPIDILTSALSAWLALCGPSKRGISLEVSETSGVWIKLWWFDPPAEHEEKCSGCGKTRAVVVSPVYREHKIERSLKGVEGALEAMGEWMKVRSEAETRHRAETEKAVRPDSGRKA